MPDLPARVSILKANLRKSPVAPDVDLNVIAQATDKYSGADLSEICQRAVKYAIRERIELVMQRKIAREKMLESGLTEDQLPEEEDPVPYVTKKHFEYAIRESRRSVSDADLLKYESFSQKMKQQRGSMGSGVANFSFPDGNNAPAAVAADEDMDGLYGDVEETPASAAPATPAAPASKPAEEDDDMDDMYDAWCVC